MTRRSFLLRTLSLAVLGVASRFWAPKAIEDEAFPIWKPRDGYRGFVIKGFELKEWTDEPAPRWDDVLVWSGEHIGGRRWVIFNYDNERS